MKREDIKIYKPKERMKNASLAWNKLKIHSSEEKKIELNDDDEKEKRKMMMKKKKDDARM